MCIYRHQLAGAEAYFGVADGPYQKLLQLEATSFGVALTHEESCDKFTFRRNRLRRSSGTDRVP